MLLNMLQCTGSSDDKELSAPNDNNAAVEDPCLSVK